jgi:hypothetical protein
MRRRALIVSLVIATSVAVSFLAASTLRAQDISDEQIKKQIVEECLTTYLQKKPCPCPYSRGCWINAWVVPGGAKPFCYGDDVSKELIAQFRNGDRQFIASRCTARH